MDFGSVNMLVVVDTDDTDTWPVLPLLYNISRALERRPSVSGWK